MVNAIDLKQFHLPPETELRKIGKTKIAIVINRESRIIRSDGEKIWEKR